MIALLAAATLSAAAPQALPAPRLFGPGSGPVARIEVLASNPAVCNKDPRMQRADLDRAILRDSDRRLYAKRLIDLPMAYLCPAGGGPKEAGK